MKNERALRKHVACLVAVLLLVAFGCERQAGFQHISASDAAALISEAKVIVIDVREPDEFSAGHIPGASLIPLGTLRDRLADLDREASYLLVCRSGNRSGQAAELLVENGFKHVLNLRGGMNGWTGAVER